MAQDEFKAQQRNLTQEQRDKAKELGIKIDNIAAVDAKDPFETMGITTLSGKLAVLGVTGVNLASVVWDYVSKRAHADKSHKRALAHGMNAEAADYAKELVKLKGLKGFSILLTNLSAKALFTGVAAGTMVNAIARMVNRRKINKIIAADEAHREALEKKEALDKNV